MIKGLVHQKPQVSLKALSQAILRLSDHYINHPEAATPWHEEYCQLAYRHYFLPLNLIRVRHVLKRADELNFFTNLEHFVDWGCGPGTASLALAQNKNALKNLKNQTLFDISSEVLKVFSDLHFELKGLQKKPP
jgi:ribosomal protein RSM22 (predicted rRNA methylase)